MYEPLSNKLRPKKLSDVLGQEHLLGENKVINNLIKNKHLSSIILYGNSGIGKTTIALAIVNELGFRYREYNAVINTKKDFDILIEEAKMYNGVILILDEIHRLNKDKQDLLLPYLENGLITLIGLTTSNPFYSINPAIRSRVIMLKLEGLNNDNIKNGIKRAINSEFLPNIKIDEDTIDYIVNISQCDLRYAYNILETAYFSSADYVISIENIKGFNSSTNFISDKNGDNYYNLLSAFQKSIRGSDVNASLHYLARLITLGDIDIIIRRLNVIVYEDIGLANPSLSIYVNSAIESVLRVGIDEGRIILSNIVIQLALSPKSNSAYKSINEAINDIENGIIGEIPNNICHNSPDYLYPHDYPNNIVKQQYMPNKLLNRTYYNPSNNVNEKRLKEILDKIKKC